MLGAGTRETMAVFANEVAWNGEEVLVVAPTMIQPSWLKSLNFGAHIVTPQYLLKVDPETFGKDLAIFVDIGFTGRQKMTVLRRILHNALRYVVRMDVRYNSAEYVYSPVTVHKVLVFKDVTHNPNLKGLLR